MLLQSHLMPAVCQPRKPVTDFVDIRRILCHQFATSRNFIWSADEQLEDEWFFFTVVTDIWWCINDVLYSLRCQRLLLACVSRYYCLLYFAPALVMVLVSATWWNCISLISMRTVHILNYRWKLEIWESCRCSIRWMCETMWLTLSSIRSGRKTLSDQRRDHEWRPSCCLSLWLPVLIVEYPCVKNNYCTNSHD